MQFYYENLYVSSFYASWGETLEALWRGALLEAAPRRGRGAAPSPSRPRCDAAAKPPHIILIHQESVVQPSLFPTLRYDHSVDPFFRSDDEQPAPAARRDLRRRLLADRVLAAGGRFDPLVRRHAPVRADLHAEQAEGHAAAGAGAVRLSQRRVLPDAAELRVQRPVLHLDRADGDLRHEGAGRQDRPGARPLLLRQRPGRDGAPLQGVAPAAVHLHPDHVGALALRLHLRARGRACPAAAPAPTRRCTSICAASRWPRWTSTT